MRPLARVGLCGLVALVALAVGWGACRHRAATDDAGVRDASRAPAGSIEPALAHRAAELAPRDAETPIDPPVAAPADATRPAAQRASVAGAEIVRGRLLAPRGMELPERTRVVAVVDDGEWQSFLHQRASGARLTLAVDAAGAFEFTWPAEADRMVLYADAPTLADVALAVVYRIGQGALEFARVERVPGAWVAPTLAPQQRVAYADGALELPAQAAIVIVGSLIEDAAAPSPRLLQQGTRPLLESTRVIVRAQLAESLEWRWSVYPGARFSFEHVPLEGPISVRIEGSDHWMNPLEIRDPVPGETRDLGALGERRYELIGRVVDAHGAPVAGAGVRALELGSAGFPQHIDWSATDADGRFLLRRVPPRGLTLVAGRTHPQFGTSGLVTRFEIAPEAVLAGTELLLELAPSTRLAGVVLRPDGSPASAALLRIPQRPRDERIWADRSRLAAATDAHGRFAFEEVPLGPLDLCAWEDRQLLDEPNLVARIEVDAGSEQLVVRLAPIAPLRGRIVSADGTAWNERWNLETSSDNVDWWGASFDTSHFEHRRLWPGRWWIQARTQTGAVTRTLEIEVPQDLAREHVLVLQP